MIEIDRLLGFLLIVSKNPLGADPTEHTNLGAAAPGKLMIVVVLTAFIFGHFLRVEIR